MLEGHVPRILIVFRFRFYLKRVNHLRSPSSFIYFGLACSTLVRHTSVWAWIQGIFELSRILAVTLEENFLCFAIPIWTQLLTLANRRVYAETGDIPWASWQIVIIKWSVVFFDQPHHTLLDALCSAFSGRRRHSRLDTTACKTCIRLPSSVHPFPWSNGLAWQSETARRLPIYLSYS